MRFRVNEGQTLPQLRTSPGKVERVVMVGGDEFEGPPTFASEFAGRITPLDEDGNPVDMVGMETLTMDLATAKAHERVSLLQEMVRRTPSLAETLAPEIARAEEAALLAADELAAKKNKPSVEAVPTKIRKVTEPPPSSPSAPIAKAENA